MTDTAPQEQSTRFRSIAAAEAIAARYGVAPIRSHLPPEAHAEWDANVVPSPRADAAQRIMQLARDYAVATADESDVAGINAAYLALQQEVIASLGDGDDSARLIDFTRYLAERFPVSCAFLRFDGGQSVVRDFNAARTAPGGASNA